MSKKKKILLVVLLIAVIGIIILLINLRKKPALPEQLVASDYLAGNVQLTYSLNKNSDDSIRFFTGTTLASLSSKSLDENSFKDSQKLFDDYDFGNVEKVRYDSAAETLLVSAFTDPGSDLVTSQTDNKSVKTLKNGRNWFIASKSGLRLVPGDQSKIVDVDVNEGNLYILRRGRTDQSLHSLSLGDNQESTLASGLKATSIVGSSSGKVVLRDYSGKLYLYKDSAVAKLFDNVAEAKFSNPENNPFIILSQYDPSAVSEEGGIASDKDHDDHPENVPGLTIYNVSTSQSKKINNKTDQFFVSGNYLISPSSISRPDTLNVYHLNNEQAQEVKIDQSQTKVKEQITSVLLPDSDLDFVAVVTNSNYLQIYGKENVVSKLTTYRLPKVPAGSSGFIFDYSVINNSVNIIHNGRTKGTVPESIEVLRSRCKCDPNQFQKTWQQRAQRPAL